MTFQECVMECFDNRELVEQFNRLHGTSLGVGGINGAVDEASGKREADMLAFIEFVRDCIWDRLTPEPLTGGAL